MAIEQFLRFIEEHCPSAFVPVDLLKLTQAIGMRMPRRLVSNPLVPFNPQCLCLVIDGECCLDRLYGGYFNDWSCGGQWNRMLQFLHILITTIRSNNIMVVVYFNGALETNRFNEWTQQEFEKHGKIRQIIRHIRRKGTPPPKILWVPPVGLKSALRMALRHYMIPVLQSVHDHKQEVVSFLRDHDFDAVVAEGAEYAFFEPPRYFSAERLKLTFRGSLETRELILDEVAKLINLHPQRFCLLAAMLGNYLVTAEELRGFYDELVANAPAENKNDYKVIVPAVVAFIRNLTTIDDVLAIANFIFRSDTDDNVRADKSARFVKSVQYYMNGTKPGYQKFFSTNALRPGTPPPDQHQLEPFASEATGGELHDVKEVPKQLEKGDVSQLQEEMERLDITEANGKVADGAVSGSSSASSSNEDLRNAGGDVVEGKEGDKEESVQKDGAGTETTPHRAAVRAARSELKRQSANKKAPPPREVPVHKHTVPHVPAEVLKTNAQRHQKGLMHPWIQNTLSKAEIKFETCIEEGIDMPPGWLIFRPIRQAVYAILFNLNHKHFLFRQQREGKTPDGAAQQAVTGNANYQEPGQYPSDLSTRIFVKEWVFWNKHNAFEFPEYVPAIPLDWRGVPTVQRLWFGQNADDKKKRMKAFLNCMCSDSALMLNQQHVPQHMLLLACVLRFMCAYPERPILQRFELDAFLAQAVSPQLSDPNAMQDMAIDSLSPRGVQLAQLFMQGVEHALFANDACGAPIPWVMCCPWLFFDGKLLQTKLELAEKRKPLLDLVANDKDLEKKVQELRKAVLEGLEMVFTRPRRQQQMMMGPGGGMNQQQHQYYQHHQQIMAAMAAGGHPQGGHPRGPRPPPFGPGGMMMDHHPRFGGPGGERMMMPPGPGGPYRGGPRGGPHFDHGGPPRYMMRPDFSRGGQLEVAGVVVGSWGGNVDKGRGPMPGGPRGGPYMPMHFPGRGGRGGGFPGPGRGGGGPPFGMPRGGGPGFMMGGGGGGPGGPFMDYGGPGGPYGGPMGGPPSLRDMAFSGNGRGGGPTSGPGVMNPWGMPGGPFGGGPGGGGGPFGGGATLPRRGMFGRDGMGEPWGGPGGAPFRRSRSLPRRGGGPFARGMGGIFESATAEDVDAMDNDEEPTGTRSKSVGPTSPEKRQEIIAADVDGGDGRSSSSSTGKGGKT